MRQVANVIISEHVVCTPTLDLYAIIRAAAVAVLVAKTAKSAPLCKAAQTFLPLYNSRA
jgi:hypothetical protein